jgi:hypothetical protein
MDAVADTAPRPPPGFVPMGQAPDQPKRGVAQDIAQGAGRGLMEGSGSILGMPSDLWHMLDRGYQFALTKGAEKLGLLTPEQGAALREPVPDAEDYSTGSEAINKHLLGLAQTAGADTSPPQTIPGDYAETIASFAPTAATMGESSIPDIAKSLGKYAVVPGAASETAGEVTKGTAAEPYARVAGAVGPAVLKGAVSSAARLSNPLRGVMGDVSPTDETAAQALLDQSRAAGAPITVPESIQQATGSATNLGNVQRVVEQSPEGGQIMKPFYAQRPQQTEDLGKSILRQIATGTPDPYEVAPKVQQASTNTVSAADQARTAAVKPLYQAAATNTVPIDDMNAFMGKIDTMIAADKSGLISPQLQKLRDALTETPANAATQASPATPRIPITDIENLDNVRKYFRDRIAQPAIAQDAIPKQVGARIGGLMDELRTMMVNNSPDFAAAKQRYQDITNTTINPLLRSPTGQLAAAETFPRQAEILFEPNPLPGSESAVANAVRQVARQDPDAASQLVRLHLERTFNEAMQNNLPGANQFGGPKFAAVVAGNTQQAKNLEAMVRALPDGDLKWGALRKGLNIMEAMGTRQPMGSATEFNRQYNQFLRSNSGQPLIDAGIVAASPGRWASLAHNIYQNFVYGRNTANFARVFTEGNVADLRALSGKSTTSFGAQAALIAALANQGTQSHQP